MQEPITILIVEDSSIQALRLRRMLEQQGWQVAVAGNGREALTYLKNNRPALVISDIFMPEMNGYEMCQAIKQDPELRSLPVLLLTTVVDVEDVFLILRAGADDYMAKPYGNEDLFAAVRSFLTPRSLPATDERGDSLSVTLTGRVYEVTADRRQMLRLLLSTYRQNVEQNRGLVSAQREIADLRQQVQELTRLVEEQNQLAATPV